MKVAVLADTHGNLPALKAALDALRNEKCDAIYHLGDVIGIGPYPAECLDELLKTRGMHLIMGNHDAMFAFGLPKSLPPSMREEEMAHHRWVHSCIDPSLRSVVAEWPYVVHEEFGALRVTFAHYGLDDSGSEFLPIVRNPDSNDLDRVFQHHLSHIVFYGHTHHVVDITGRRRYVNPGSLGCYFEPVSRLVVLEVGGSGAFELAKRAVTYDHRDFFCEFERRNVPDRDYICRNFFQRHPT